MRRVMVFDRYDAPLFELSEGELFGLERTEQVNGEHALEVTTTRQLEQGQRVLLQDDTGKWREYVVFGTDAQHESGNRPIGTYYCTWSVQPDLMGTRVSREPGVQSPVTAGVALEAALSGTARWNSGTVTNTNTGGASMYDTDGWDAISILVENWGGEVDTTIEVGASGVALRKVDLYDVMGEDNPKRRFDFGADLKSVKRRVEDGPLYCRITPRGKGEETEGGGYGRKITIASVNDGKDYLENPDMVGLAKLPDGNGGWEYPTLEVENSDCETPAELLAWAQSVLLDYTMPRVTYEVDVLQLAREGIDAQGVSLGDSVQVVDRRFGDGLRLTGRVTAMKFDELSGRAASLTIGYIDQGLAGAFGSLGKSVSKLTEAVQAINGGTMSTADYITRIIDRINAEINATGGYTYITEGQGIRTYDKAVSDPLVGAEADAVVEVKGGTIRIANSRTAQGEWDWKTVFTSGHIAANLVTAANLTAGYIGNAGGSYWDLDNDILQIASTAGIGDRTVLEVLAGLYETISDVFYEYAQNQSTVNPPSGGWTTTLPTWLSDYYIWARQATKYGTGEDAYTVRGDAFRIPSNGSAGISSVTGRYYLSTSNTAQEGGSWSSTRPTWQANRFIWTRLMVGWDDTTTTYTTPTLAVTANALADALGDVANSASDASKVATNFLTFDSEDGLDIGYSGTSAKTRINGNAVEIFDGAGNSALYAGLQDGTSLIRVGEENRGNVQMDSSGSVSIRRQSEELAHFGWGEVYYSPSLTQPGPYYTIGSRESGSAIGLSSTAIGMRNEAEVWGSVALGYRCIGSGQYSVAIGHECKTTDESGVALGWNCVSTYRQVACGRFNVKDTSREYVFIVGSGSNINFRRDSFTVDTTGKCWAQQLSYTSDKRLKEHIGYLGDDAVEFVRSLKPALFVFNDELHLGFYAQDVEESDHWGTATVSSHADASRDFDPLTLDYTALIAPLVAYAQSLEERIAELEERVSALEGGAE